MKIEEIIKKHVTSGKSPGISVGLINESDVQTFNYGEIEKKSNIEPTVDTVFEIGSMTKTFTVTLAAQLQQEGILSLDDPITNFLPELKNSQFDKNNINLYHLLTHTSGISEISLNIYISQMFSLMTTGKSRVTEYEYNTGKISKLYFYIKTKKFTWKYMDVFKSRFWFGRKNT